MQPMWVYYRIVLAVLGCVADTNGACEAAAETLCGGISMEWRCVLA